MTGSRICWMLKMETGGWRSYDDCRHKLPGGCLCLFQSKGLTSVPIPGHKGN